MTDDRWPGPCCHTGQVSQAKHLHLGLPSHTGFYPCGAVLQPHDCPLGQKWEGLAVRRLNRLGWHAGCLCPLLTRRIYCPAQVATAEMCDTRYSSIRPQHFPVHRADKKPQVQVHAPGPYREHKDSLGRTAGLLTKLQRLRLAGKEEQYLTPLSTAHRGQEMRESEMHQAGAGCPLGTQVRQTVVVACSQSPSAGTS